MAEPVFVHRLVLHTDATVRNVTAVDVVRDLLASVEVPAVSGDRRTQSRTDDAYRG
jgi:MoxR-like ATPase